MTRKICAYHYMQSGHGYEYHVWAGGVSRLCIYMLCMYIHTSIYTHTGISAMSGRTIVQAARSSLIRGAIEVLLKPSTLSWRYGIVIEVLQNPLYYHGNMVTWPTSHHIAFVVWSVNREIISIHLRTVNALEKILCANNIFSIYI